jgi:hypothetical protein
MGGIPQGKYSMTKTGLEFPILQYSNTPKIVGDCSRKTPYDDLIHRTDDRNKGSGRTSDLRLQI